MLNLSMLIEHHARVQPDREAIVCGPVRLTYAQFDAAARPMYRSFTGSPDLAPYTHRPAGVDLNARNTRTAWGAEKSLKLDLEIEDRAGGLARNLPVPIEFNDSELAYIVDEALMPLGRRFDADAVVIQCGADALADDPMSRLGLSNRALWAAVATRSESKSCSGDIGLSAMRVNSVSSFSLSFVATLVRLYARLAAIHRIRAFTS